jgi:hypothetical protein
MISYSEKNADLSIPITFSVSTDDPAIQARRFKKREKPPEPFPFDYEDHKDILHPDTYGYMTVSRPFGLGCSRRIFCKLGAIALSAANL